MSDMKTPPEVTVESLQADLTAAQEVIDGQTATIADLQAQVDAYQADPPTVPSFTLDKKTYAVHAKTFQFGKQSYTVAELLKDKTLQKALVEKGVGFIVEQTKTKEG